ncbi:nuclear transport factor 2 family protein [Hydrocarboniphaga sp.]|uniref:nuclear transport factor 2 family protein n=1 Tax=Hydrocarboniphaga sp. TaxID=2033016 RepID=UPI003D0ACACD
MKAHYCFSLAAAGLLSVSGVLAQERVVGANDPDALFHSHDPKLDANKQIVYHIYKDILEGSNVKALDQYLSARYIQHNPNIPSGHDGLRKMLSMVKPKPASEKLSAHVVSVVAEGDYVVVATVQPLPDPRNPGKTYTTTHFDMWRIQDGKADEHWDEAQLGPPPGATPSSAQ